MSLGEKYLCPDDRVPHRFQQLDLIQSRLRVMLGTFYNLHGYEALVPEKHTQW